MSRSLDIDLTCKLAEQYDRHTLELYGVAYSCSSGNESVDTFYEAGGKGLITQLVVFIRKTLLPTLTLEQMTMESESPIEEYSGPPRSGSLVKFDGVEYRMGRVTNIGGAFRIQLHDADSSAR